MSTEDNEAIVGRWFEQGPPGRLHQHLDAALVARDLEAEGALEGLAVPTGGGSRLRPYGAHPKR